MERVEVDYLPCHEEFVVRHGQYSHQYNQTYQSRLSCTRNHLLARVEKEWNGKLGGGNDCLTVLERVIDVEKEVFHEQEAVLIGMIFKDTRLRVSILDDATQTQTHNPVHLSMEQSLLLPSSAAAAEDLLVLEDMSGRANLTGLLVEKIVQTTVTGVMTAVRGRLNELGDFVVTDALFAYDVSVESPNDTHSSLDLATLNAELSAPGGSKRKFVLFTSGWQLGESTSDVTHHDLSLTLLTDLLTGKIACGNHFVERIAQMFIVGDSVTHVAPSATSTTRTKSATTIGAAENMKQLDVYLAQLASSLPIQLLPGSTDPVSFLLPQQPVHRCLLPESTRFNSLHLVPNPSSCTLDGVRLTGHSGQAVDDIVRHTYYPTTEAMNEDDGVTTRPTSGSTDDNLYANASTEIVRRLDVIQRTLQWGHICPTAPDTLPSYPFQKEDPFFITEENIPDVFYVGNQMLGASRLVKVRGIKEEKIVRLISVPSFRQTGTVVLCDVSDPSLPTFNLTIAHNIR